MKNKLFLPFFLLICFFNIVTQAQTSDDAYKKELKAKLQWTEANYDVALQNLNSAKQIYQKLNLQDSVYKLIPVIAEFYQTTRTKDLQIHTTDCEVEEIQNIYYPVNRIVSIQGDTCLVEIEGGSHDGIRNETYGKAYPVYNKELGLERNIAWLGDAKVISTEKNRATVAVTLIDAKDSSRMIYPKDVINIPSMVCRSKVANSLFDLVRKNIIITDNFNKPLLDVRQIPYLTQRDVSDIMEVIKIALLEIVEVYSDESNDKRLFMPMEQGIYKGYSVLQALEITTNDELIAFFDAMNAYPDKLIGRQWKISDIYAAWIFQGAFLGPENLKKYLFRILEKDKSDSIIHRLDDRFYSDKIFLHWKNEVPHLLTSGKINEAALTVELLHKTANILNDSLFKAWALYAEGKLLTNTKKIDEAIEKYKRAKQLFEELGNEIGVAFCKGDIKTAPTSVKATVIVQNGHSLPFETAISPDGKRLATAGWDNLLKIWNIRLGREITTIAEHKDIINSVQFSNDGRFIISADDGGSIKIWNSYNFQPIRNINVAYTPLCAIFNSSGNKIFVGGNDSTIHIYNANSGEAIKTLQGHKGEVNSICFFPNENYIASGASDSLVLMWNIKTGKNIEDYRANGEVKYVTVSKKDDYLLAASTDSLIRIWRYVKDQFVGTLHCPLTRIATDMYVAKPDFSPDGKYLAFVDKNLSFSIINLKKNRSINYKTGHDFFIGSLKFTPDGKQLISSGHDLKLYKWDMHHWSENSSRIHFDQIKGYADPPACLSFHPSGKKLAVKGYSTYIWGLDDGKTQLCLANNPGFLNAVQFSNQGRLLVALHSGNEVVFIDHEMQKNEKKFQFPKERIAVFQVSKSDSLLAVATRSGYLKVLNIYTGDTVFKWGHKHFKAQDDEFLNIQFNHDSKILALSLSKGETFLFDLMTKKLIKKISVSQGKIFGLAFSPGGKYLAIGLNDNDIHLFDAKNFEKVREFTGHQYFILSLNFSHNGKILASSSADYTVRLWDVKNGKEIYKYQHSSFVSATAFSPDDKLLVSAELNNMLVFHDVPKQVEKLKVFPVEKKDFVAVTDDNYYLMTKKSRNSVAFSYNMQIYPFEQFDLIFNRPDIVLNKLQIISPQLQKAYKAAYLKRLEKMNFSEDMLSNEFHLPEVTIEQRLQLPTITKTRDFKLIIKAKDTKYLLDRINIWINGVPVYGMNGYNLRDKVLKQYTSEFILYLSKGMNKIQVSVMNENGVESLKETVEIKYTGETPKPSLHIAVIGISKYKDEKMNLHYAAKDAKDIAKLFASQKEKYDNIYTYRIINSDATRQNILQLKNMFLKSHVDDKVILFFAGHGVLDKELNYYLATYNMDFGNPKQKGLPYSAFEKLLDSIPAREKLLFIDACHSGEVDKNDSQLVSQQPVVKDNITFRGIKFTGNRGMSVLGLQNSFELMKELFADLRRGTGAMVISSAGGGEFAYESKQWNNGVFTYAILEGLRTQHADLNKNNSIPVSELRDYVFNKVNELTNGRQNPTARRENLEFDFQIW